MQNHENDIIPINKDCIKVQTGVEREHFYSLEQTDIVSTYCDNRLLEHSTSQSINLHAIDALVAVVMFSGFTLLWFFSRPIKKWMNS